MVTPSGPTPPNTNLNLHAVKKEPDIRISADGKKAIMEFGGDEWEVTIEDLDTSSTGSDKHLTINQEVARRVHSCFKEVIREQSLDRTDVAEISLSGRATKDPTSRRFSKIEIDTVETVTEQVDTSDPTKKTTKRTSVTVNSAAKKALETLGEELVKKDAVLRTPSSSSASSSGINTGSVSSGAGSSPAASAAASPLPPPLAAPTKADAIKKHFTGRRLVGTATIDNIAAQLVSTRASSPTLRTKLAKFIGNTGSFSSSGNKFNQDPKFTNVFTDLRHIYQEDQTLIESALSDPSNRFKQEDITAIRTLLSSTSAPSTTIDGTTRGNLLKVYVKYLENGGQKMGESFYKLLIDAVNDSSFPQPYGGKDFQIAIVNEQSGMLHIHPAPPLRPSNCIFLKKDNLGAFSIYDKAEVAGTGSGSPPKFINLHTASQKDVEQAPAPSSGSASGAAAASPPPPATTSPATPAYYDLGTAGRGRCADLCLADQLLRRNGNRNPSEADRERKAEELRDLAIRTISSPTFLDSQYNRALIRQSMQSALQSGTLPTHRIASSLMAIRASISDTGNFESKTIDALKQLSSTDQCPRYKGVFDKQDATGTTQNDDPFDALKFYIYQAAIADPSFTTPDTNFGQTVIDNVNDSSHPEYKTYIKQALQTLILRALQETTRIESLSVDDTPSTEASPTAEEAELANIYTDLLNRNERESSSDVATLAAIAQAQNSIPEHGRPFNIVIVAQNQGGADEDDHPYKIRQIITSNPNPDPSAVITFSPDDLYIFHKDAEGHFYSFNRDKTFYDALTI